MKRVMYEPTFQCYVFIYLLLFIYLLFLGYFFIFVEALTPN